MSTTSTVRLVRPGTSTRDIHHSRSGSQLAALLDKVQLWLARIWERDELRHRINDKRLLDDIGLRREQVLREVDKSFWQ